VKGQKVKKAKKAKSSGAKYVDGKGAGLSYQAAILRAVASSVAPRRG
jgi:hypothetical protein